MSEHRAPIVFWIGAGVSADAGLPSWQSLRDTMYDASLEELVSLPSEQADELEAKLAQAKSTGSYWKQFSVFREILGDPIYNALVRENLGKADTVDVPELHKIIWSLGATRGVVSLNIDALETRAHSAVRGAAGLEVFSGKSIARHMHVFRDKGHFVARLHGTHSDRSTWVFTEEELGNHIADPAYMSAVQAIFANFTVIFLGISADDIAAGGILEKLTGVGADTGNHFWITDRNTSDARNWSQNAGVIRVPYTIGGHETHTSVLKGMFQKIKRYVSKDTRESPISFDGEASTCLPALSVLRGMDEDAARLELNKFAKHIIDENANRTDVSEYRDFIEEYSPAIHQASHLSLTQGYNKFFGFTAVEKVHSGPFSSVWRVCDTEHNSYALKILQMDNILRGPQMESFRRGIASQKLLRSSGDFSGTAKIEKAFEIPPSVIMEFVEGENLEKICSFSDFSFWEEGVEILIKLCEEIHRTHKSKFGILHRDIRPTNVMVPNFYYGAEASDHGLDQFAIKMLNYDLTWHKDAAGRVVPPNPGSSGYYAPELISEPDSVRARDTRVDSYGLGMTIFRMASGKIPPHSGSTSSDWGSYLNLIRPNNGVWFRPAHNFVRRLVDEATKEIPNDRIYVADMIVRLEQLRTAVARGCQRACLSTLAENLMYALCVDDYEVRPDGHKFTREIGGYRTYQLDANRNKRRVDLLYVNTQSNGSDWTGIDKSWSSKLQAAKEMLVSGGWKVEARTEYSQRTITLSASIEEDMLRSAYDKAENALTRAIERVRID